jgi:hypothetical protein
MMIPMKTLSNHKSKNQLLSKRLSKKLLHKKTICSPKTPMMTQTKTVMLESPLRKSLSQQKSNPSLSFNSRKS